MVDHQKIGSDLSVALGSLFYAWASGTSQWISYDNLLLAEDFLQLYLKYHLVMTNSLPWKITMLFIGKPSINGPCSMAMLNNQRVVYVESFWTPSA
jgi:hypothetical protein